MDTGSLFWAKSGWNQHLGSQKSAQVYFGWDLILGLGFFLGGDYTIFPEFFIFFCTRHNFFPLSSVQISIIPACCLLCVL